MNGFVSVNELQAILNILTGENPATPAVLATLVKTVGSHSRQPGARALFSDDKLLAGSLSGGCLEDDLLERCQDIIASGKTELVAYDSTGDDDSTWGLGLGCDGQAYVLLERIDSNNDLALLQVIQEQSQKRQRLALATVFRAEGANSALVGRRIALCDNGDISANRDNHKYDDNILKLLNDTLRSERSTTAVLGATGEEIEVLLEIFVPPPALIICGVSPLTNPLVTLAADLGWPTTVVDHRSAKLESGLIPSGAQTLIAEPEEALSKLRLDNRTAVVIVSHHYQLDLRWLKALFPSPAGYIGALSSQGRMKRLLGDLKKEAGPIEPERLARLYCPVGLDIGSETPAEMALCIVAEIKTVFSGKQGGFLRKSFDAQ